MINPTAEIKYTGGYFYFGASVSCSIDGACISNTLAELWNGFCCTAGTLTFTPHGKNTMQIGIATARTADGCSCTVTVTECGVAVCGRDRQALINGYMTLLTMIEPVCLDRGNERFRIPCCTADITPVIDRRMIHLCVFPETKLTFLRRMIRLCGVLCYTHIVLEFWGTLQFDCLKELSWEGAYTKEQIRPLISEAHDMGIEIIPMFNHWGHASACRVRSGKHVVLDQNPRLQLLFDGDGWTWNIESPQVRQILRCVREELIELTGGSLFHIGCDEAYWHTDGDAGPLARYLNDIAAHLKNKGITPVMWGDMLLHAPTVGVADGYTCNCPSAQTSQKLLSALDHDILIADWQYGAASAPIKTADYLSSLGYRVICCPWNGSGNISAHTETAQKQGMYGVMLTTWHTLRCNITSVMFCAGKCHRTNVRMTEHDAYTAIAALMRRACARGGNYADSGWCERQINGEI